MVTPPKQGAALRIVRFLAVAVLVVALFAPGAEANDSSAALGTGGVVLTQSAEVRMASEDLYISPKEIRIRYTFVNDGKEDVATVVAFPLPDIDSSYLSMQPIGTVTEDQINFVGFTAKVDGKPVDVHVEQRAIYKGKDVTAKVLETGAAINLVTAPQNTDPTPEAKQQLVSEGLADGAGKDEMFIPRWTIRTKLYWTQTFPAGRTVTVEHRYQPVTGSFFVESMSLTDPAIAKDMDRNFCLDAATKAMIHKRLDEATQRVPGDVGGPGLLVANQTDYILKTARNWKGPIGKFHLTLDKLKTDNVLSLCWDGTLTKTSATRFEFSTNEFVPSRDIRMLVLSSSAE
jgi:hypothetical protein